MNIVREPCKIKNSGEQASLLLVLRKQLQEKFPAAHAERASPDFTAPPLVKNLPVFPAGALSELSPAHPASGLSLILSELLKTDHKTEIQTCFGVGSPPSYQNPVALIDGRDSFDPASYGTESCARLLWIRCRNSNESLRCCDLLLHDGSLPLIVLDLLLNPLRELSLIPSSSWYRLRNLAEQTSSSVLIFTPRHLIPCASLQLFLDSAFTLSDLIRERDELSLIYYHRKIAARG